MNSITGIPTWNNYYKYMAFNPTLVIIIIVIIIIYLMLFGSLGDLQLMIQDQILEDLKF